MLTYQEIAKMLLKCEELPKSPYSRYLKDQYSTWKYLYKEFDITYEDFEKEFLQNLQKQINNEACKHPVIYDKTVEINKFESLNIRKKEGKDIELYYCNLAQNGSSGYISVEDIGKYIYDEYELKYIESEIKKIMEL
jgi:hypothetical protein